MQLTSKARPGQARASAVAVVLCLWDCTMGNDGEGAGPLDWVGGGSADAKGISPGDDTHSYYWKLERGGGEGEDKRRDGRGGRGKGERAEVSNTRSSPWAE